MAVEKCHPPPIDWFPINLTFTMIFGLPTGTDVYRNNELSIMALRKNVWHCTVKTRRGSVSQVKVKDCNICGNTEEPC